MLNPSQLPAATGLTTRTLSSRLLSREIGGQILVGDERTLMELAFKTGPEQVQVKDGYRVYEGHDLAKIYVNKALKVVFEIVGLKPEQEPRAEMMKLLVRHAYQTYPHFRVQDVYEAFVQAVAGAFPAKLTHFGQVDMAFFVNVWKAYDKYAYPPVAEASRLLPRLSAVQEYLRHREATSTAAKDVLRAAYAKVLETGSVGVVLLPDAQWYLLYGFDWADDLTEEKRTLTYEQACKRVLAEKNRSVSIHHHISIEVVKERYHQACHQEAYRLLVSETLLRMKADGVELRILESELARVSYINPQELLSLVRQQA